MALQYFLYNTDYNNTIVNRSETSFSPVSPYEEIYIDFFIPETQPLYLYANSGGTGGTIIVNTQEDIDNYLSSIELPQTPSGNVTYGEFTGKTTDLQSQIAILSGGTVNIDTILTVAPSGATFTSIQAAINSITDASTNKRYLIQVYNGTYTEDISMKNYVFVQGVNISTVKVNGDLTVAPFGFGFTKLNAIEFITQDKPTANINTIGLVTLDNVVLTSNWSGNTAFKSVMNIEKAGLIQMVGDASTMRLVDTYTGVTQTKNYLIYAQSGSSATNFSSKNSRYQQDVYGNIAEIGLVLHANPIDSEITIDDYDFNVNLHGSAPTHLIKLKNITGGNGEIEASDASTIIDSDNAATPTIISAYVSGSTSSAYIDYSTSKLDWSQNINDEDIYIGAAITVNDGIRVLNVVFETEADTIPLLYTADGNFGEHNYSIYNGVGTSFNSEITITDSLILGGISGNSVNKIETQLLANSTTSLVSEFGIRTFASNPENIIYSNTGWTGTSSNVSAYLDETTELLDSISPTGYVYSGSPVLRTGALEITVFAGEGYVVNNDTLTHVTWTGETIDTSAYALGQWYIYVDINGTVFTSQSILDSKQYIQIGSFLQITGLSASVLGSGRNIENYGTKVLDYFDRSQAFIYDKGGKVSVTGTTSVMIEFPPLKIQHILDNYDITETVYSTQGATKFFTWFNTTDSGWIQNYDFYRHAGGEVNLRLWNDTSGVSNYEVSGGSLTFTSGSTTVTAGFDMSTELIVGYYLYLQSDGITYMNRIDGITGTTLTLAHSYDGSGGTGTALAVTALLPVPSDKYVKHLVYRDFNGIADLVYNNTYVNTLADIKSEPRFVLPGELGNSVVHLAEVISTASEISYEVYLNDIRPIPYGDYDQTTPIDTVNIHGELVGLSADDHLQYLRTDGTRDLTGIQSYDTNYTFTSDTNLITKKFVDDKKYDTSVITGGTFNVAQIPDLNANKITGGTFNVAQIPDLNASIITGGTLLQSVIPDLNAIIITGGTLLQSVIPDLNAIIITGGTLLQSVIPDLNTSIITGGTFGIDRLGTGATTGSFLKATSPTTQSWEDIVISDVTNLQTELDGKLGTGYTPTWVSLDFTSSTLADIETRNAADVNVSVPDWTSTNVDDFIQKSAQYMEDVLGSGRISPEIVLYGKLTNVLNVSGGTGYINYTDYHKEITWSAQTFNMSGYTEGIYYVYVDTNGDIQIVTSAPNNMTTISLGLFYFGGTVIGVIEQSGGIINSSIDRIINFSLRQGQFIYDNGGNVQIGTGNTLSIVSSAMKVQSGLLDYSLGAISSTNAATYQFVNFYNTADLDWEFNYYFNGGGQGLIPVNRWNDITQNSSIELTGYNLNFTNGSNIVTSTSDLTLLLSNNNFLYKTSDTSLYLTPVSAVTWTGSQTNITLETPYLGTGGNGLATANYAIPYLGTGHTKHLIIRTTDNQMILILGQTTFNSHEEAVSGPIPAIPESLVQSAIKIALLVVNSADISLSGDIYDIRPLPFQYREGGQIGSGIVITVHGDLDGLDADDHLQYLRTDGTRNLIGIQSYQSNPTFTVDTQLISKKYADDANNLKLNISTFSTYTGTTIPNTYYNKTIIDNYTGTTNTRLNTIDSEISYISGVTDNKLNISTFSTYTGTTIPNTYYSKTVINSYTGTTAILIGTKQNTITGAATTITTSDLTVNRALISDASGKVAVSTVTSTQLGYVAGVTSAIQTQLNEKADLANPTFTGVPTAPTAAENTNTIQIATTAYVVGQASTENPIINGSVAVGTSLKYSREDHIHPTDTSRQATITGAATTITTTNLTADRVVISNGSGKVAVSTVTAAQLLASAANIYGSEYQLVESLAASTTSSTTPQTKLTMTTTTLPSGTYKISVNWIASHSSASNSALFDVTLNGTPLDVSQITKEWKDTTDYIPFGRVYFQTLSGVNTILLRYWNESNSTTISDATIELIRVS